jgi:hypothetical protein
MLSVIIHQRNILNTIKNTASFARALGDGSGNKDSSFGITRVDGTNVSSIAPTSGRWAYNVGYLINEPFKIYFLGNTSGCRIKAMLVLMVLNL